MTAQGWQSILDDDEEILWQGQPDPKVRLGVKNIIGMVFGLMFSAFALVWMVLAAQAGGFFWMFGLLHFSVGLLIAFVALFWETFLRRRVWYTLTNQRAFVASDLPVLGRRLKSYPIDEDTVLEFVDEEPASIYFAQEQRRGKRSTYTVKVGFQKIPDGRKLFRMFRDVQRNAE